MDNDQLQQSHWKPKAAMSNNPTPSSELTSYGKFSKSDATDTFIPSKKRKHDPFASALTHPFSPVIVHRSRSCSPVLLGSMSLDVLQIDRGAITKQLSVPTGTLSVDSITGGESSSLPPVLAPTEPKKRVLKKGSIGGKAFESSLSGLKNAIDLMCTGGAKKVKSTQEIIAGLQNRGGKDEEDVDSGGQFMQSGPTLSSFDSDSTDDTRLTTTSVSTPESVINDAEKRYVLAATFPPARSTEEELAELDAQLHPIDAVAVALAIEASSEDIAPCSCYLIEVDGIPIAEALSSLSAKPTGSQMPRFEIIEDPDCLAAEYYHAQRGDVCEEHLEILHNAYVPNVNGNWDNGCAALDNEIEPDLYERIVPTFNHMCNDRIPKNLCNITFNPELKVRTVREDDEVYDEDKIDAENEYDEDEEDVELITVPDNAANIVPAERNDLENCTKTIVSLQCHDDDVANNNAEQIGEAKPFIDTIEIIAEHADDRTESDAIEALPADSVIVLTKAPIYEAQHTERVAYERLTNTNYGQLPSFDNLTNDNVSGRTTDGARFKEWHEVVRVRSYNDELLTILPYVVFD